MRVYVDLICVFDLNEIFKCLLVTSCQWTNMIIAKCTQKITIKYLLRTLRFELYEQISKTNQ